MADEETDKERINRNLEQLLQELRVALPGVQVLFAFLLAVPFSRGFSDVSDGQRYLYFACLLLAAISSALLIAPTMHHRLLFRQEDKRHLVETANALTIAGMTTLACAITLALVLVADYLFGTLTAWIVGGATVGLFGMLWYALPLQRRLAHQHSNLGPSGREDERG